MKGDPSLGLQGHRILVDIYWVHISLEFHVNLEACVLLAPFPLFQPMQSRIFGAKLACPCIGQGVVFVYGGDILPPKALSKTLR